MRRSLTALFCLIALAMPALFAQAGGWLSPSTSRTLPEIVTGDGGPFDGMLAKVLDDRQSKDCWIEDFTATMPDMNLTVPAATDAQWSRSGITVTGINTVTTALHARVTGQGVLAMTTGEGGTGTGDGVSLVFDGYGRMFSITLDASPANDVIQLGRFFDVRQMALGLTYGNNLEFNFVTQLAVNQLTAGDWNSALALGFGAPGDTQLMATATGALTAWAAGSEGIMFHISEAGVLTINAKDGAVITSAGSYAFGTASNAGANVLMLGFKYNPTPGVGPGTGSLTAYYKHYAGPTNPPGFSGEVNIPWTVLGTLSGDVFPDLDTTKPDYYKLHVEAHNNNTAARDASVLMNYVAGCERREGDITS